MTIYDQIKDEYDMILIEKLQRSQPYHQAKLISMNILQVNKILPSNKKIIIEQAKFTYSPLTKLLKTKTKTIEDQREKQVKTFKNNKKQINNTNAIYYKY